MAGGPQARERELEVSFHRDCHSERSEESSMISTANLR